MPAAWLVSLQVACPHETGLFTATRPDLRLGLRARYALPGAAVEPLSGDYVLAVTGTGDLTFKRLISDDGRILLR